MDDVTGMGVGGISGLVGVITGWLGFKSRLDAVEKRQEKCQTKDVCDERDEGFQRRFDSIDEINKEMRDDIKQLLRKGCGESK